ncbi:Nn.00g001930.m01.CDS01 [Neocucurbitaria sp. VM-36]
MSLLQDAYPRPRMPSPQPSFARMTAAINIPSSRASPALTASYLNGSLQSTPEGMVPISSSLPAIPSYNLPEPYLPQLLSSTPTSSPSAMAEALGKGPGLIRRVSRGAQGIPHRFRRGNSSARDKSSGPVMMRRRSDSRTAADGDTGISDFDTFEEEEAVEDFHEPINALGISNNMSSFSSIPDSTVVAPVRNSRLEQGTVLRKITKKEKKEINLRLDLESAKVFWDPSRPSKCFYIDDVREIRSGPEAKHYREECGLSENWAPYWFTIVYTDTTRSKGRIKTMHLIAPDIGVFNMWTHTLDSVSRNRIDMMAGLLGFADKSAKLVWQRAMKKRGEGESLDFPSIVELCRSLHINCTETTLRAYFEKADTLRAGKLNQSQFLYFVRRLKERKDIKAIYKSFTSGPKAEMDKVTFFSFLQREQGVNVNADLEYWTATFEKFARATKPKATPTEGGEIPLPLAMNFPAFQTYLTSPANSIFKPVSSEQQLDRPLNEYYISSSHNTYLLGRQVAGESSTEAYITALQKGCRCLEIDCWDGNDNRPVVMHGRTLTKSISFQDTIKVINKYAFTESPYPVILSLEVHCSYGQQADMVKIMMAEFGEKLVLQPLDFESQTLPSPEELKHRILIKVKAAAGEDLDTRAFMGELSTRRQRSFSSPWSRPVLLNDNVIPNSPLLSSPPSMSPPERSASFWASPRSSNNTIPTSTMVSSAEDSDSPTATAAETTEAIEAAEDRKKPKKAKTSNITKELGNLGVYTRGVKFTDFGSIDANTFNHVYSINERAFEKLTRPGAREKHLVEEHNMRCLMRVYPHAFRINSSNFDPLKFWRRGVQMAALNWQTYDLGQQLNEAMFAGGDDRTGYVLKPAALRLESQAPVIGHTKAPKKQVKFSVQIISAQQLPRPRGLGQEANINPYVEFEMYCAEDVGANATGVGGQDASARNGHSGIGNPLRKRTRIVEGNGYNPEFGNEIDMTVTTRYPSLVFVRWTVWNSLDARTTNHAPLATFTAKLNSIQQGFRHLPLFDSNGEQYLFSTLFCKIKKQDIVDAPEAGLQRAGSHRSLFEPASPLQEPTTTKASRNFVRRLISRAPSERKKRKDERTGSESRESDLDLASRSSTFER